MLMLITALHRASRRADALEAHRRIRTTLRDELGTEPGQELARVHVKTLRDGDTPVLPG